MELTDTEKAHLEAATLTATARDIAQAAMWAHVDTKAFSCLTLDQLAYDFKVSERTIRRATESLIKSDAIVRLDTGPLTDGFVLWIVGERFTKRDTGSI